MGLQLTGLTEKYGTGNKTLTDKLDEITNQYASLSLENYNKYLTTLKSIDENAKIHLDLYDQANTLQNKIADKRFNEYLANNGALLLNTNLKNMANEVKN